MELITGFEPVTSSLPNKYLTEEVSKINRIERSTIHSLQSNHYTLLCPFCVVETNLLHSKLRNLKALRKHVQKTETINPSIYKECRSAKN